MFDEPVGGQTIAIVGHPDESVAAVQSQASDVRLVAADFELDPYSRRLRRGDREMTLTPRQFAIMVALMRAAGQPLSRVQLSAAAGVRTSKELIACRSLDTHIQRLRQMIEDTPSQPRHIVTVKQYGYQFVPSAA